MKYLNLVLEVIRIASDIIIALCLGYLLADEVNERMLRRQLRLVCQEQFSVMQGSIDEQKALLIKHQCRQIVP